MRRLRDAMTRASRLRYLAWRATGLPRTLNAKLASGERLFLRPEPADDLQIAREIFIDEVYRSPRKLDRSSVKRLVDVGANVGYSVLYFSREYPEASIDAFEPHPQHRVQMESHLRANRDSGRILVHPVAVGAKAGAVKLSDEGVGSQIVSNDAAGFPIEMVDFFDWAASNQIDLLKLDCEGTEYELLMDARFEAIKPKTIVLEWHATEAHPNAERDILARLDALDFEVTRVSRHEIPDGRYGFSAVGVAWAYRREASQP